MGKIYIVCFVAFLTNWDFGETGGINITLFCSIEHCKMEFHKSFFVFFHFGRRYIQGHNIKWNAVIKCGQNVSMYPTLQKQLPCK